MTLSPFMEILMITVILLGIVVAIWRGGANNPVGTGGLDTRLTVISSKVTEIEGRVEHIEENGATAEDMKRLEASLVAHAADLKRIGDEVARLPDRIDTNRAETSKIVKSLPDLDSRQRAISDKVTNLQTDNAKLTEAMLHITKQVDRLYDVLVPKGMRK